jgi:hypothetical protein
MKFFDQKFKFSYPEASIKTSKLQGEAFCPQKRTYSTLKPRGSGTVAVTVIVTVWTPGSDVQV